MPIPLDQLAFIVLFAGIGIRLLSARRYIDAHARAHGAAPPRNWLWTRDADAVVESARLRLAAGSVVALVGLALLVISFLTPRAG